AYSGSAVRFELFGRGIPFFRGVWDASVTLDGREVGVEGDWEAVCWNADEDADYLVLQLNVGDKLRIDRQFLLPRSGRPAILADSVLAPGARQIVYRS